MLKLTKGILITIEGIDGSGKTTLAHNLFTVLKAKNFDVIATREPGASDVAAGFEQDFSRTRKSLDFN